jgi:catechol 2,3-dioxygenase-like lactoylglutathione lyase family enzyme
MGIRIGSTVLNVADVERGIAFWTAALGYVVRDPDVDHQDFAVLAHPERAWSNLSVQRSARPKSDVNRVHLDLYVDHRDAEVERLLALGATRVEPWPYDDGDDFVVLADPDGNEFCVVPVP